MELSQEAQQGDLSRPADHTLDEAILRCIIATNAKEGTSAASAPAIRDEVMALLVDTGHVLPGCPPAAKILDDAKAFHERLVLSNLALRIFVMLGSMTIETPESKPAQRFIIDYLEGRNHGPVGEPMLWPGQLPGLASVLRDWGFVPTVATPGQPSYVARAMEPVVPS